MSKPAVECFVKMFKGNLVIQPGTNHTAIVRKDGAKVPNPQTNFTGHPDKIITDKANNFISVTPGPYSEAIFELLNFAMQNYPIDGKVAALASVEEAPAKPEVAAPEQAPTKEISNG